MQYDFLTGPNRSGSGSEKWDLMYRLKPDVSPGVIPLSVADMEFQTPPEIKNGLQQYLEHAVLGYSHGTDAYYDAVIDWQKRRFGFEVQREWIQESPGVVPALYALAEEFTAPGDGILLLTPVYYPFYKAAEYAGRKVVESPLLEENGYYTIDFDDLEQKAARPENTMLIFCSPHNPVGRVWTEQELRRVAELCARHNVLLVSDEIHQDIIMPGHRHTTMGTAAKDSSVNWVICTAPSKTFNLAGMNLSNIIIRDKETMARFQSQLTRRGIGRCGPLSYKACELAYTRCAPWLEQLLARIDENRRLAENFFKAHFPSFVISPLEGTYLLWVNFSGLGLDHLALEQKMIHRAEAFLDEGYIFGPGGRGWERFNLACPPNALTETLERIGAAFKHS